jgi:hypothetical protein
MVVCLLYVCQQSFFDWLGNDIEKDGSSRLIAAKADGSLDALFDTDGEMSFETFRSLFRHPSLDSDQEGLHFEPSVIVGLVVVIMTMLSLTVSGASLDPIYSTSTAMLTLKASNLWIYWLAPYLGALLAAVAL